MMAATTLHVIVTGLNKMKRLSPEGGHFTVQFFRRAGQTDGQQPAAVQLLVLEPAITRAWAPCQALPERGAVLDCSGSPRN